MNQVTSKTKHLLEEWSMWQLLDFKGSFQKSKQLLCDYCETWREKRREENPKAGKHGGVTANTRDLVRAILRILPRSMEWIREHRQSIFKKCISTNLYAIITTSGTLRRQMAERMDGDDSAETDLVSRSTVFEALKVLEAAGIIFARKAIVNPGDLDKKAMLIYINPNALSLFSPANDFELPEAVTDVINENSAECPGEPEKGIVQFSDYYNTSIRSIENEDNNAHAVDNVSPAGDEPQKAELVRSTESKDPVRPLPKVPTPAAGPGAILWKTCKNMLYEDRNFDLSTISQSEDLLQAHYDAAVLFIEQLRKDAISAFCKTRKYLEKADKGKPALLKWFVEKSMPGMLKNPEHSAFGIVMDALRMQASASRKHGFATYYPTVFLSQNYGLEKYLKIAKNDLLLECTSPIGERCALIRVKSVLRSWVSSFMAGLKKSGAAWAVAQVDHYLERASALLKAEESIDIEERRNFYRHFKNQIISNLQ